MINKQKLSIAVLPGDGIGNKVIPAAMPVFEALQIPVDLHYGDIGWEYWKNEGNPVPKRTWDLIESADTTIVGAITSKPQRESRLELSPSLQDRNLNYLSPIIQLRQNLRLFANVRPCFSITQETKQFDLTIIRENMEGLYAGFDYYPIPNHIKALTEESPYWCEFENQDISCTLRLQSRAGLMRLFSFAFEYAHKHQIKVVTFADKPNVLRKSSMLAREVFESVSDQYKDIKAEILNVDAVALWMVRRPERFGVIVAENMFGDILSDLGAGIMGGLGFAPSGNYGLKGSYFEPVHGSAPNIDQNGANPSAMFLTIALLLKHYGFETQSLKIIDAVKETVNNGKHVTYDMGGKATTVDMANQIIELCLKNGA